MSDLPTADKHRLIVSNLRQRSFSVIKEGAVATSHVVALVNEIRALRADVHECTASLLEAIDKVKKATEHDHG